MPGADFKFHLQLPNFVQTGVTLVKRIPDVFLMASFFIFVFLQNFFLAWKAAWCSESSLPEKCLFWGLTFVLLMRLRSVSSSEGVWVCPRDSLDWDDAAYRSRLRFSPDRRDRRGGRTVKRMTEVENTSGYYWRHLEAGGGCWNFQNTVAKNIDFFFFFFCFNGSSINRSKKRKM